MTEQTINGIPFPMKELCDFSFLQAYGSVFQVFAQNDSGNISFGVSQGERRFFLKVAGAPTAYSCLSPAQAVENLRTALPLYQRLAHPSLIRLVEHFPQGELYVAVFQWAEGDCLFDHWNFERYAATGELSPGERFRRLPQRKSWRPSGRCSPFCATWRSKAMPRWISTTAACSTILQRAA